MWLHKMQMSNHALLSDLTPQPTIRYQILIRFWDDKKFQGFQRWITFEVKKYFQPSETQNRNLMPGRNQILSQNQILGKRLKYKKEPQLSLCLILIRVRAWLFKDPFFTCLRTCQVVRGMNPCQLDFLSGLG